MSAFGGHRARALLYSAAGTLVLRSILPLRYSLRFSSRIVPRTSSPALFNPFRVMSLPPTGGIDWRVRGWGSLQKWSNHVHRPASRFHVACALCLQVLLLSSSQPCLAYIRPSRWPSRRGDATQTPSANPPSRWYSSASCSRRSTCQSARSPGSSDHDKNGSRKGSSKNPSSYASSTSPMRRSAYYYNNLDKLSHRGKSSGPGRAVKDNLLPTSQAAPASTAAVASTSAPRPPIHFELTKGVAGSRKTQHAVSTAFQAGSAGAMKNILFLVKVGSNAQEIRSRLETQMGLEFKRHKLTNHFVARDNRSPMPDAEVVEGGGRGRGRGRGVTRRISAGATASYWVASFDAFVDCQLRTHLSMQEKLKTRGANFEWKRDALVRLIRAGAHGGFCLKDGALADFVVVDEVGGRVGYGRWGRRWSRGGESGGK